MNAVVTNLSGLVKDTNTKQVRADGPSIRTDAHSKGAPQKKRRRKRTYLALARSAVIVMGIGLAIVIPLGWGQWVAGLTNQTTDNAYLRADTTPISSQIAGRVERMAVRDYERVSAGDLLAEIEPAEYRAKVERASAAVAAAEAAIRNVDSQIALQHRIIAQADAGILAIEADRDRAASEHIRQTMLVRDGWSTSQRLEGAVAEIKRFEAQMSEKRAEAEAQRQQLEVLKTQRDQAQAELGSRKAELDLAQIDLRHTQIMAPFDGVVNASSARSGQYVSVGTRIISVVPLPNVYAVANYKETQLEKVSVGQSVSITIDTFPGRTLTGWVEEIAPASGSEFALLPADNATGNFTKVAQRITVKIKLDVVPEDLKPLLRPGMSVVSTIHTDVSRSH